MEHSDFINELKRFGYSFKTLKPDDKAYVKIFGAFDKHYYIEISNFKCEYVNHNTYNVIPALHLMIREAIDMDFWKHSLHNKIAPENYEKFMELIQEKMIARAEEIDFLNTVYSQLQHEISKQNDGL